MDDKAANADGLGSVDDTTCGILEQGTAETFAVMGSGDRKPPKNYHRNRIRHVAAKVAWSCSGCDRRGCQGVVADNPRLFAHNEGTRCAADLIGHGTTFQPGVERFDPTVETGDDMVEREWLRSTLHLLQAADQGALVRMVFCRRLFGCAG